MPDPNEDLVADIARDYLEAAAIVDQSPRGARQRFSVLRFKSCVVELGGNGKKVDDDIATLVAEGLDPRVQKALDVVRVADNNAVHPGVIDLRDDKNTAIRLFGLVNLVADIMITQRKHIDAMFDSLPAGALEGIERRDKK